LGGLTYRRGGSFFNFSKFPGAPPYFFFGPGDPPRGFFGPDFGPLFFFLGGHFPPGFEGGNFLPVFFTTHEGGCRTGLFFFPPPIWGGGGTDSWGSQKLVGGEGDFFKQRGGFKTRGCRNFSLGTTARKPTKGGGGKQPGLGPLFFFLSLVCCFPTIYLAHILCGDPLAGEQKRVLSPQKEIATLGGRAPTISSKKTFEERHTQKTPCVRTKAS